MNKYLDKIINAGFMSLAAAFLIFTIYYVIYAIFFLPELGNVVNDKIINERNEKEKNIIIQDLIISGTSFLVLFISSSLYMIYKEKSKK